MNIQKYNEAKEILKNYNGTNDYILKIQNKWRYSQSYTINKNDVDYIIDNHAITPVIKDKWVPIKKAASIDIKNHFELDYEPEYIYVFKLLVNDKKNKKIHVYGKLVPEHNNNYPFYLYKNQIKETRLTKDVDFSKYNYRPPKDYQVTGIYELIKNNRFILGDEMGTGKTLMSIIAALEAKFEKILIICPASMKYTWKREISFYDDSENVSVIENTKEWKTNKWVIINYDILSYFHKLPESKDELKLSYIEENQTFDCLILDEAHKVKNKKSKRSRIVNDLSKNIKTVWLLTGTPVTNKPIDYYHLLEIIDSPLANNWMNFVKRYCNGKKIKMGDRSFWKTDGATNLEELNKKTEDVLLRRRKDDILDLPDKITTPIHLKFTDYQRKKYNKLVEEFKEWAEDEENNNVAAQLTELIKLRQFLSESKIQDTISLIENSIEEGNKVIVFACFSNALNKIYEHFSKNAVKVDGSTPNKEREKNQRKFQENVKTQVFVGQIQAAGEGLTLTAGNTVIFNDLDWSPSIHNQASDRAHRITQSSKVSIMYPIFLDTLDENMFYKLINKQQNIDSILGDSNQPLSKTNVLSFLNKDN